MAEGWLKEFGALVQKKSLVIIQFNDDDWERLRDSRRGANEFTIARSHELLGDFRAPTACLVLGRSRHTEEAEAYFGLITSRQAI